MYSKTILMVPLNLYFSVTLFVICPKEGDQVATVIASQEGLEVVDHLVPLVLLEHIDNLS